MTESHKLTISLWVNRLKRLRMELNDLRYFKSSPITYSLTSYILVYFLYNDLV